MPRNGSGVYSLPAGNPVVPGTTIDTSWANSTMEDLGNELTNSLSRTGAGGMLGPLRLTDGTITAPSLAFTSETNTGLYRSGAASAWMAVLGANIAQFSSTGVVIASGKALTVQGNATVGGTFGVTGAATLSSTLSVTGAITATGGVLGNVTAASGTSTFNNVTINGDLDMNAGSSGTITNLPNPTNSGDAANKAYVDAQDALRLALTGGTMTGAIAMSNQKITGVGTPSADGDAANKAYVDSVAQGLDIKASVRAATTGNITLSGTQTIDGVSIGVGDRVLVKDQSTAAQNGIYVAASSSWSRSSDADTWAELVGAFVFVEDGTTNDNSGWVCTVAPGGTLGSTAVTWEQFSGAGQINAGTGMTKTGNTLNVNTASSSRIVVGADEIDLATTGVTASTYKSVTVDAYGRVTAGTNPTTLAGFGIGDAYTQTQVDNLLAAKLSLSGGTMTGAIAMGTYKITGLGDPTLAQDAATKNYIDTIFGSTTSAAASAAAAASSASAASTSASNASTSASNASTSATNAASSAGSALSYLNTFRGQYLGASATNPTVDGNGNALTAGDLYFNTTSSEMRVYTGSAWAAAYIPGVSAATPTTLGTVYGSMTTAGASPYLTAAGYNAGAVATGLNNSFFGFEAGKAVSTGTNNAAFGYQALLVANTAVQNTAFGANALKATTTGGYNTAVGSAALNKTTGTYNTGVGVGALEENLGGANNAAFGAYALNKNTTASNNTAMGYQALYNNTTGDSNVAVGYKAGTGITTGRKNIAIGSEDATFGDKGPMSTGPVTGSLNIAIGPRTLVNLTSGAYNIALGDASSSAITTGNYNVSAGLAALTTLTTGEYNVAIGRRALESATTSSNNIAIGAFSLTVTNTGTNNTAVGTLALQANTTASQNTAIGTQALYANTTASGNTAVGYQTLYNNTTGANNVGLGYQCALTNTTGGGLVAVGYGALYSNTTGKSNTAVGGSYYTSGPLRNNTTGELNVAIGEGALQANTTASGSTAMGYRALNSNTTGTTNTAIGYQCLYNNTTGTNNVALGSGCGTNITTGGNNIAIGYNALYGSGSITNGNNIAIGTNTLASISGSVYNNLCIGNAAGFNVTTGNYNFYIGAQYPAGDEGAGFFMTTGSGNTILGGWNGNADSLDLRTSSSQIVIGTAAYPGGLWGARLDRSSSSNSWYQRSNSSSWATTSDRRIKTNFQPVTNGLEIINALKPTEFDYILTGQHDVSFIAQEYEEVLPDQVVEDTSNRDKDMLALTNGEPLKVLRKNLDPYLVSAIQALTEQVNQLKAEIATLKGA